MHQLTVWVPVDDIVAGADRTEGTADDRHLDTAISVDGAFVGDDPADNRAESPLGPGVGWAVTFTDDDRRGITPPDGADRFDHDVAATPGQDIGVRFSVRNTGVVALSDIDACLGFDAHLDLVGPAPATLTTPLTSAPDLSGARIEFGVGKGSAVTAGDEPDRCEGGAWSADPDDPVLGGRAAIDRVRLVGTGDAEPGAGYVVELAARVTDDARSATRKGSPLWVVANGSVRSRDLDPAWLPSTFTDPLAPCCGVKGARLSVTEAITGVELTRSTRRPPDAGDLHRIQVRPSLILPGTADSAALVDVAVVAKGGGEFRPSAWPEDTPTPTAWCTACDGTDWRAEAPTRASGVLFSWRDVGSEGMPREFDLDLVVPATLRSGRVIVVEATASSPQDTSPERYRSHRIEVPVVGRAAIAADAWPDKTEHRLDEDIVIHHRVVNNSPGEIGALTLEVRLPVELGAPGRLDVRGLHQWRGTSAVEASDRSWPAPYSTTDDVSWSCLGGSGCVQPGAARRLRINWVGDDGARLEPGGVLEFEVVLGARSEPLSDEPAVAFHIVSAVDEIAVPAVSPLVQVLGIRATVPGAPTTTLAGPPPDSTVSVTHPTTAQTSEPTGDTTSASGSPQPRTGVPAPASPSTPGTTHPSTLPVTGGQLVGTVMLAACLLLAGASSRFGRRRVVPSHSDRTPHPDGLLLPRSNGSSPG